MSIDFWIITIAFQATRVYRACDHTVQFLPHFHSFPCFRYCLTTICFPTLAELLLIMQTCYIIKLRYAAELAASHLPFFIRSGCFYAVSSRKTLNLYIFKQLLHSPRCAITSTAFIFRTCFRFAVKQEIMCKEMKSTWDAMSTLKKTFSCAL